jgi:hypothetical protein
MARLARCAQDQCVLYMRMINPPQERVHGHESPGQPDH